MLVLNFKAHRHLLGSLYVQFHPQNLGLFSDVARYLGLCGTGPGHQVRLPFALISGLDIWRLELASTCTRDRSVDFRIETLVALRATTVIIIIVHRQSLACYPLAGTNPSPRLYLHFLT
jgi:hypothetical protein